MVFNNEPQDFNIRGLFAEQGQLVAQRMGYLLHCEEREPSLAGPSVASTSQRFEFVTALEATGLGQLIARHLKSPLPHHL